MAKAARFKLVTTATKTVQKKRQPSFPSGQGVAQRSIMGRQVVHHSPDQHPAQKDPLARQPDIAWADFGPVASEGSESYTTALEKRGRLAGIGKRGFKPNPYGSGGVN